MPISGKFVLFRNTKMTQYITRIRYFSVGNKKYVRYLKCNMNSANNNESSSCSPFSLTVDGKEFNEQYAHTYTHMRTHIHTRAPT